MLRNKNMSVISNTSSGFDPSSSANLTLSFSGFKIDIDSTQLSEIDFLDMIIPASPESLSSISSDAFSSSETLQESLNHQDIRNETLMTSNTFTTGDNSVCYSISQADTNENKGEEENLLNKTPVIMNLRKSSHASENGLRNGIGSKRTHRRSLKFPPCIICSGKASGLHYGAITCEACKGFFRRHLQKKTDFKCSKDGSCEITSGKIGICSGCRLKKCLYIGMSKEKSKIGRYTSSKRTETIVRMKQLEENSALDKIVDVHYVLQVENGRDVNNNGFNDQFVTKLVQAMNDLELYGPNIKTKEHLQECHRRVSENFVRKIELFGKLGTVPKEEFYKLYKEFGIDIDGRIADMRNEFADFENQVTRFENFANQIPGFSDLHQEDQTNLLKVSMADFYTAVAHDCYNDQYKTFVSTDGQGYHLEDLVDKYYSRDLITIISEMHCCWQKLHLSAEETALVSALTVVCADRCKLKNRSLVENAQLSIIELLQKYLRKTGRQNSRRRFAKIMDALIKTREMSELFIKEQNAICNDALLLEELPCITFLFVEDSY